MLNLINKITIFGYLIFLVIIFIYRGESRQFFPEINEITQSVNHLRKISVNSKITPLIINKGTLYISVTAANYLSEWEKVMTQGIAEIWQLFAGAILIIGYIRLYMHQKQLFPAASLIIFSAPIFPAAARFTAVIIILYGIRIIMAETRLQLSQVKGCRTVRSGNRKHH